MDTLNIAPGKKRKAQAALPKEKAQQVVRAASALVKEHPAATAVTAGALVGAGVLVGVVAQRALHHERTVGEAVMSAIKRSAAKVSKQVSTAAAQRVSAGKAGARRGFR